MDPTVIVVHRDNPLVQRGISLPELEALFGREPRHEPTPLQIWEALLGARYSGRIVRAFGPAHDSPLYQRFRRAALHGGDFRDDLVELAGSEAVVAQVSADSDGIGYASLSALVGAAAPVPVATEPGATHHLPTAENLHKKRYPLSAGALVLYINHRPSVALDAQQRELLRFIYSREGQRLAAAMGLVPVSAMQAAEELQRADILLSPEDVLLASTGASHQHP